MIDYHNVIVHKPWGYEYQMYENESVALWYLYIKPGNKTSMHCHPLKKTGLVLLSGEAEVSFFNDSFQLKAVNKLIMRPGLFHSTTALSPDGAIVLETETPPKKEDLVRLYDAYGREEKPYEGTEAMSPMTEDCLRLELPEKDKPKKYSLFGCTLSMEFMQNSAESKYRNKDEVIVVLKGGLFSKNNDQVLTPGDVIATTTLIRLANSFETQDGMYILAIQKERGDC